MTYDRVRIINPDHSIAVVDKSFSQMCEMIAPLSKEEKDRFWRKQGGDVVLPTGHKIWLVQEGV